MEKLDLTKAFKEYYRAKPIPELVVFGEIPYLSIDGKGDPSGEEFALSLKALYSVAYALKFYYKAKHLDFVVAKLEGLWWYDENVYKSLTIESASSSVPRSEWFYRLLIRIPEYVEGDVLALIADKVSSEKKILLAKQVAIRRCNEGKVVQMLHVGSFDREPESLLLLQEFMRKHGLSRNGLHHEVYLSDFRKTPSERLRTILREPVQ